MNPFEKQMQLGRELMELNTQWLSKIAEFDTENFKHYVEMNQTFAQKLPEANDIQSFMDLQREYGESLWKNTQEVVKARGELLQTAMEENGELLKNVMTPTQEESTPKRKSRSGKAA